MSDESPTFRIPDQRHYSGKLPDEVFKEILASVEKYREKWEEAQLFDIQVPYLTQLSIEEPFLGSLSRRIEKVKTDVIPTAAVSVSRSGDMQMLWNPVFFKHMLTPQHVLGVYKHELYHVIFEHITSRLQEPHTLWNAATDCAINCLIERSELPAFTLCPGELFTPADAKPDWKPGILAQVISELPKMLSAEQYMAAFLADDRVKGAMARARQSAAQRAVQRQASKGQAGQTPDAADQPGDGAPESPDGQSDRDFDKALQDELYDGGDGGQFDDHDAWEMSDEQRDQVRDAVRDTFRDCVREAEGSAKGWGSVPQSVQHHLKKLLSNEVDWRDLINQFIGRSRSTSTTSTLKRVNRRAPWDYPGRKRMYRARPAVSLDQSGSMENWWVELLFAEMDNLGSLTEFDVIPFDYDVDVENIQHIRRGQKPNPIRTKSGGTNFSAPVKYVNENAKGKYDVHFCLTDGGCGSPIPSVIPMAYILAPGCELLFDPGNVPVIKMTDVRKKG